MLTLTEIKWLHQKIEQAGIPIIGLAGDRVIEFEDSATPPQRAAAAEMVAKFEPLEAAKAEALSYLNAWRGARRAALGLTAATFQELVYTGKALECQRWLADKESNFGLAGEAAARGLTNEQMAGLVSGQWSAWQAGSDAIEAEYITARLALLAAADEAGIVAALAGLN